MTKSEYMQALREKLHRYNGALQQEILEDYEQHFAEGLAEGRSEEEIIAELGNIEDMLQEFSEEDLKQEIEAVEAQSNQNGSYDAIYREVVIEGLLADVEISESADDELRVSYVNEGNEAQKLRYYFYQYEEDGVFYAGVKERRGGSDGSKSIKGIWDLFSRSSWAGSNIELSVEIPARIPGVKLHTTSGDLTVQGLRNQAVEAQCTSGDLRLEELHCEKLCGMTQSGDLEAEDVQAGRELKLTTTSGDMEVTKVSAPAINLQSTSGDLRAERVQTDNLQVQTASGDLDLDEAVSDQIYLQTASGDIEGREIRGGSLRVGTGSGDAELDADVEICTVKTGSGSISLEGCRKLQKVQLYSASGDVCLDLEKVEGATIVTRTGSGDMVIRGYEASGRSYNCSYGSGACQVEITTASGDIEVQ